MGQFIIIVAIEIQFGAKVHPLGEKVVFKILCHGTIFKFVTTTSEDKVNSENGAVGLSVGRIVFGFSGFI